jgi:hypothetical protein
VCSSSVCRFRAFSVSRNETFVLSQKKKIFKILTTNIFYFILQNKVKR